MGLTENEQKLLEGFEWLANTTHEAHHRSMIEIGQRYFAECDAKTCKYAASIVRWAKEMQAT